MIAFDRRYAAVPEAVAQARRALDDLTRALRPSCVDTLRLLVSEVVTNAVRYGPRGRDSMVDLRVEFLDQTVRVEVEDRGHGFELRQGPAEDGASGWGLYLVDQLAHRWGIGSGGHTHVWFELDGCVVPEEERPQGSWPATWDPLLLDELRAAVVGTDLDGVITRWNGHAEQLFGWSAAEAIGRKVTELLVAPADAAAAEAIVDRLRRGEPWEGEWWAPHADGSRVWIHVANAPVRHPDGSLLGMVGVSIETGERHRAQEELDRRLRELGESERRFRLLSEGSPTAILAFDLSGEPLYANRRAEELTGFAGKELSPDRLLDQIHPADLARVRPLWRRVLSGGEMRDIEFRVVEDDQSRWRRATWVPLLDERGRRIGIQGRIEDVTERREREAALAAREEQLRLALSAAGMGTWDWDIASGRVEWSEGLERIHGLPPGGFGGTFDDFQRDIHREDRESLLASIADAVSTGADYRHDYRIRLPDGTIRWLSVRGQVFHEGSTPVRMAGVGMDITERKELEQRLELKDAVADVLTDAGSVESAAPAILEAVGTSMGWQLGTMWVVDEEQGVLRPAGRWAAGSPAAPPHAPDTDLGPGVGLAGRVWSAASPVWIRDLAAEPELLVDPVGDEMPVRSGFGFAAMLGRRVVGVLEFWSRSIRDPEPSSLQMVRVLGSQIGQFLERKGAEQAVLESEAVKTAVLSSSLEAIITMDEVGRVVELNPAAETMFGIRREEVVGRELAAVLIPEPYRARHREGLDAYRRTGRGAILGRRVEMTGLRSDGEEFPIELSVVRVDLPGPALFTATIRDIADRRRAQELRLDLLAKERAARGEAEAARDRLTFLADASVILASSLDTRRTLAKVARLAVPRLADWCSVDLLEPDGSIHSVAVAHVDPEKIALAREYRLRFPPKPDRPRGAFQAVRTGEPYLIHEISDEELRRNLADPEELSLGRQLGIRSIMVVPLVARGRGLGAVTFASAESGRLFGPPDLELAEDLARRAALAIDNAGLYEERSHIARTLQRSLLPSSLPEIPGVEVAALYQPATITRTEVGGDFYDLFEIGPDAWGVAMGDVCGKGVEAAALTGLARHTVRAAALRRSGPRVVLDDLNEALRREGGDRFCTVVYSRLERGDGGIRMITSCGGHPLPVLIRAEGTVEPIAEPGTLIGIFEDLQLSQRVVELHPGDAVLFFTDGLIDPRVAVPMDEPAVHELLGACAGLSAQQIVDRFKDAMEQAEALDDLALLALRVTS